MPINLDNIVLWCRSYSEYVKFFNLTESDLKKKILSSADGASSFNFEAKHKEYNIVSHDPIYKHSPEYIKNLISYSFERIFPELLNNKSDYNWDIFKNPDDLKEHRISSMLKFLEDFSIDSSKSRYIYGELPELPFRSNSFDIALVSHFLFLYSGKLTLDFHVYSIENLIKVAEEVRIFPITGNLRNNRPGHLSQVLQHLHCKGLQTEIIKVDYHFCKGLNSMLKIKRGS